MTLHVQVRCKKENESCHMLLQSVLQVLILPDIHCHLLNPQVCRYCNCTDMLGDMD